jgi:hypothetical protein
MLFKPEFIVDPLARTDFVAPCAGVMLVFQFIASAGDSLGGVPPQPAVATRHVLWKPAFFKPVHRMEVQPRLPLLLGQR